MQGNIARMSALASKMGQIKKVKARYHPNSHCGALAHMPT
jgi:hypothetical protein